MLLAFFALAEISTVDRSQMSGSHINKLVDLRLANNVSKDQLFDIELNKSTQTQREEGMLSRPLMRDNTKLKDFMVSNEK